MSLTEYIDRIVYDSGGHTGNTYYFRMVRRSNAHIWDNVAEEFAATPDWIDSAIALVESDQAGQFPVLIPEALPAGVVDVIVYLQAGSDPANTDNVESQWTTTKGSVFGF